MSARARSLTMQDVKAHKSKDSVWIVIHNKVYDVTRFLNEHPGGADSILDYAGDDATQAFEDVGHSSDARDLMKSMEIGKLDPNKPPFKGPPPPFPTGGRVNAIVVPRDRSKSQSQPIYYSVIPSLGQDPSQRPRQDPRPRYWPWALAVLAGALVVGIVVKKYYA